MPKTIRQTTGDTRSIPGGVEISLTFGLDGDERIPAVLMVPDAPEPVAAALLIHGYASRKEHLAESIGRELVARGIAALATDLPLHGTRADPVEAQAARNPIGMMRLWRRALTESRLALHFLQARPEVDRARVAVLGYSLGSYLAVLLASEEKAVRAAVVAAGGDLPSNTPFAAMARMVADPIRAVRSLGGRPLLVVHGRNDRTVLPEQAERLFAAAAEPKELRWYDAGHHLPPRAGGEVAEWLAARMPGWSA